MKVGRVFIGGMTYVSYKYTKYSQKTCKIKFE